MQMFGEKPAERRPAGARGRVDDREIAVVAAAFLGRGSIAQDHDRHRGKPGAADPLHGASGDQHEDRGRERAD